MNYRRNDGPIGCFIVLWLGSLLLALAFWGVVFVLGIEAIQWLRRN